MKHPGHIRITDNKVKFEYYELEKPNVSTKYKEYYDYRWRKFKASKRVIEVNNAYKKKLNVFGYYVWRLKDKSFNTINIALRDGKLCEAEVENNVAVITQIL